MIWHIRHQPLDNMDSNSNSLSDISLISLAAKRNKLPLFVQFSYYPRRHRHFTPTPASIIQQPPLQMACQLTHFSPPNFSNREVLLLSKMYSMDGTGSTCISNSSAASSQMGMPVEPTILKLTPQGEQSIKFLAITSSKKCVCLQTDMRK